MTAVFNHPVLGSLKGRLAGSSLLQLSSIPYGSIAQRFARSAVLESLDTPSGSTFDATGIPPVSIQPKEAPISDCKGNQFPPDILEGYSEEQSEDCLYLNITIPASATSKHRLPVITFFHGGAFLLGSGYRPYYTPTTFCQRAIDNQKPFIFVSANYRLGALGFFHSSEAKHLIPPNNGLHDQLIAMQWIKHNIAGFGGDPENITVLGQSAGGESVSLHNLSGYKENVWKRSIQLAGSLVTMPSKTPKEHEENFRSQAEALKIDVSDGRSSEEIAKEMIQIPVDKIRDLGFVGAPCSDDGEILPYPKPTMALTRKRSPPSKNLESQIVGSCTFDGGISYNMMIIDDSRKNHAKAIQSIARDVLKNPGELLDIYDLKDEGEEDSAALKKICQFESDIGFFAASLSLAQGFPGKTYLLIFDLPNPFEDGPLPAGKHATHTWDIVSILGAYEGRLSSEHKEVINSLRDILIKYIKDGEKPWPAWTPEEGHAMIVSKEGLQVVKKEGYMGEGSRRGRLLKLAEEEAGEDGCDLLWEGVCRRFLMKGE